MNDSLLFSAGLVVFGLMLVGIISTVLEFKQVGKKDKRRELNEKGGSEGG